MPYLNYVRDICLPVSGLGSDYWIINPWGPDKCLYGPKDMLYRRVKQNIKRVRDILAAVRTSNIFVSWPRCDTGLDLYSDVRERSRPPTFSLNWFCLGTCITRRYRVNAWGPAQYKARLLAGFHPHRIWLLAPPKKWDIAMDILNGSTICVVPKIDF